MIHDRHYINGRLPGDNSLRMLNHARGQPIQKANGGICSIGIGETLLCWTWWCDFTEEGFAEDYGVSRLELRPGV